MSLKNILKIIKQNESSISTVLGFVIIVIIGLLVVNYFRDLDSNGEITDIADNSMEQQEGRHIIAEGESLWSIAERYYDDGFRWVDIMEANNIENPADIEVGQEINIPNADVEVIADAGQVESAQDVVVDATPSAEPEVIAQVDQSEVEKVMQNENTETNARTYTVVHGDNLWDIAVELYGNGYRWVDIARTNELVQPGTIHAGNVLEIPA